MNGKIKILDCTLRDGGYVNDWNFGEKAITSIVSSLREAEIDLIEVGYLSQYTNATSDEKRKTVQGKTIFTSLEQVNGLLQEMPDGHYACMINYGEYDVETLPSYEGQGIRILRIAFHREDMQNALRYCEQIREKGYEVFVQPMSTMDYTEEELNLLIARCNAFSPAAVYIVDSFGFMQQTDVRRMFTTYNELLAKDIAIGFHSHNNLQLSFPNSQEIIRLSDERAVIIDSSVFGMGRGAGNLCTELLVKYLNEQQDKHYHLVPILEIIDNELNPIFIHSPWGYSLPYYAASVNKCHPNYATWLQNKQTLGVRQLNLILSRIPEEKRRRFDRQLVEQLYMEYQGIEIDDENTIQYLRNLLEEHQVLLLAPGKTIHTYKTDILDYIDKYRPVVFSINFQPSELPADLLFMSNTKRIGLLKSFPRDRVIATSNIVNDLFHWRVNYGSLVEPNQEESDNAGLMLLRLLKKIGVRDVAIAGYDGFSQDVHENYCDDQYINSTITEIFAERNQNVGKQLRQMCQTMNICFLTPTRYLSK